MLSIVLFFHRTEYEKLIARSEDHATQNYGVKPHLCSSKYLGVQAYTPLPLDRCIEDTQFLFAVSVDPLLQQRISTSIDIGETKRDDGTGKVGLRPQTVLTYRLSHKIPTTVSPFIKRFRGLLNF